VFSFFRQFGLQRRMTEIEEARRQEEVTASMRADLTARFEVYVTSSGRKGYHLLLVNRGPARAEKVSFELLEPDEGETPSMFMEGHEFPIAMVPGQEYPIMAAVVMGTAAAVDAVLRWTDGTGPREEILTLTVRG
jgi:hypothetical protein